ncbi:peptidylprolyl isomerase [Aquimarina sp. ERC-38]|uniref:peptidylprolyl isomerase n=1 Tax=Aquimarina sp. ERC-38 TaxID=2949996 RepID=UPI0022486A90|nr:peptidylprolyl isomerase [Aquimarina sp. ERC-38]UZO81445.1 peptidylprolyl isomerase [Aquimarina sp. ERC-38]
MAVLNKIRQRSVFLIVIIALALFSFVLADLIRNGGAISQKSQNTIATINGKEIDRTDFAKKVEQASRNFGPNGSNMQAVNYVWDQQIKEAVYDEQFEELGIRVGANQVNNLLEESLANNPTFQNEEGGFDRAKMQEYVANIRETSPQQYQAWQDYKISLGKQALEDTYLTMVKAGVGATLKEGELAYKMENDGVDIKYVQLPYSSIADSTVTVSENEIQSYIDQHKDQYKTEATRNLRYVFFEEKASPEDEEAIKASVQNLLNGDTKTTGLKDLPEDEVADFINLNSSTPFNDTFVFKKELPTVVADTLYSLSVGGVYGPYKDGDSYKVSKIVAQKQLPDSLKARHILISWKGLRTANGDTTRTKEQAKQLADSLLTVVKRDKSKFATFAAEYSADSSNKDKGGDLGYFAPGRMVPAFNDYLLENNVGSMGVVETDFGYHIIKVEDKKNLQKAVKVATVSQKIESSEETNDQIFTETTKFQIATKDGDFEEKAKEQNYTVRPVNKLEELADNIPGLGAQRSIVQWAFKEDTKVGDVKRFETKDGYAVVQVTSKAAKGTQTAKDAQALVKPILIKKKKAEMLKEKISGSSLEDIASKNGQTVKTASKLNLKNPTISGAGREPNVIGVASNLEKGKVSKPITGENGVYVIEVTGKTPGSGLDSYNSYANQESKTRQNAVNSRVFSALKDAADIEDKRANFY